MNGEAGADHLRARLVDLDRQLQTLAADDLAARFDLQTEADAVRRALKDLLGHQATEASKDWADRADRKGSHDNADWAAAAKAAIPTHIDPGSAGG